MPWWGWVLLVWFAAVLLICLFFAGASKLNDQCDREEEEMRRRG